MPPASTDADALLDRVLAWAEGLGARRRPQDRWVAGVCSGVGARLGIDPVVIRVAMVTLTLMTGLGLLAYAVAYLLLPTADDPAPLARARASGTPSAALVAGLIALAVVGVGLGLSGPGGIDWTNAGDVVPLAVLAFLGYRIAIRRSGSRQRSGHQRGQRQRSKRQRNRGMPGSAVAPGFAPAAPGSPVSDAPPTAAPGDLGDLGAGLPPYAPPVLIPVPPIGPYAVAPPPAVAAGSARAPAVTARTPRPRHRRLGPVGTLLALGGGLAAYGIAVLVHPGTGTTDTTVGLGAALAVMGLTLLVAGALGRRGGLLTLVGIALAAATAMSATGGTQVWSDGVGTRTWAVTTGADTAYRLGAGQATLDLTRMPTTTAAAPTHLDVRVGFGQVVILVPPGRTIQLTGRIGAGTINENGREIASSDPTGLPIDRRIGTGSPDAVVAVDITAGSVEIVRR